VRGEGLECVEDPFSMPGARPVPAAYIAQGFGWHLVPTMPVHRLMGTRQVYMGWCEPVLFAEVTCQDDPSEAEPEPQAEAAV